MKREEIANFVKANNQLKVIANDIISKFVEKEKAILPKYKEKLGTSMLFSRYENPFAEDEYIFMFSEKYAEGEMHFDGEYIEINGYTESRDFGVESYQFFLDVELVEKYEDKEYLEKRIQEIVTNKLEHEYQKTKEKIEEDKKKREEMERLKNDEEYQLYLELKKKYDGSIRIK